jgi:predicted RNA-binding Zn-ribbon protein involved in translation (DUF1610 family)
MDINSKKLERTSKFIYYSISLLLCFFLVLLSNNIIEDLDTTTSRPELNNFENKTNQKTLESKKSTIENEIEKLIFNKSVIEKTIATAKANSSNEKQSFSNWIQTRKTLGSPDKDIEVLNRAKKLDGLYEIENKWRTELNAQENQIELKVKQQEIIQLKIDKEKELAYKNYDDSLKVYDLKVFLIRLLFVGPILVLGIFFFVRFRKNKFWPLYFGFTLFSLYAFFFGLVPYLPSYGGYVRYAVGIILSGGLGFYAIKTIRQYIENKQAEIKMPTQERSKNLKIEVAEKAFEAHFCPSCGKDFMIRKWESPVQSSETQTFKLMTDFCRHCGLELFKDCSNCGNHNFSHLPFCASCGEKTTIS